MNLLTFEASELHDGGTLEVTDRRARHLVEVLRVQVGDEVLVGQLDGNLGRARVTALEGLRHTSPRVELEVLGLDEPPPAKHPLVLAVALPRPPTLTRVLEQGAALGVGRFVFFGSARVEKSYWQSHAVRTESLREHLRLGLEQCVDTVLPTVQLVPRFRVFAEDVLPTLVPGVAPWVADLDPRGRGPEPVSAARVLVVGPEGGFVPFEREVFASVGCEVLTLGHRRLRVETAVVALLGALAPRA